MKKIFILITLIAPFTVLGQGLHFSQYYNAPILLNPANTGFHTSGDMRIGINYRSQWLTVPVPYSTTSAFADFGINKSEGGNWLGIGVAFWKDKAGDGDLALTKAQINAAYHIQMNENSTFSLGMTAAYSQRSVNMSKLTFERQWDEFSFNTGADNGEDNRNQKSSFADLAVGVNYVYYNQNDFSLKFSAAAMHINRPKESFFDAENKLGIRPMINVEAVYKANSSIIISPSVMYAQQKKASELVMGSLFTINVNSYAAAPTNEFILGAFYRLQDAMIGTMGYRYKHYQLMVSYDHTVSDYQRANQSIGAFEFSLIMERPYHGDNGTEAFACPRF